MPKNKNYVIKVYTTPVSKKSSSRLDIRVIYSGPPKMPGWSKGILGMIPKNHGFDITRKNKIVTGKRNAWPLPKTKGNRY